jgi:hypothetical protein
LGIFEFFIIVPSVTFIGHLGQPQIYYSCSLSILLCSFIYLIGSEHDYSIIQEKKKLFHVEEIEGSGGDFDNSIFSISLKLTDQFHFASQNKDQSFDNIFPHDMSDGDVISRLIQELNLDGIKLLLFNNEYLIAHEKEMHPYMIKEFSTFKNDFIEFLGNFSKAKDRNAIWKSIEEFNLKHFTQTFKKPFDDSEYSNEYILKSFVASFDSILCSMYIPFFRKLILKGYYNSHYCFKMQNKLQDQIKILKKNNELIEEKDELYKTQIKDLKNLLRWVLGFSFGLISVVLYFLIKGNKLI